MFEELRRKQLAYDEFVLIYKNLRYNEDELFIKKSHALMCEVWEVANEIQYFKYWKIGKSGRNKIEEELADCLFFQLSLFNMLGAEVLEYPIDENEDREILTVQDIFQKLSKYAAKLMDSKYDNLMRRTFLKKFYTYYIELLRLMNITKEDMIHTYIQKYKVNIIRQLEDY